MLLHIANVLTADDLRDIGRVLDTAPWGDGRETAGHRSARVKRNLQLPVDLPEAQRLGALISERLYAKPEFVAAALPLRIVPPRFNRYEGEGHYGAHVDSAIFPAPGGASVRSDVSITVFLNDPAEYDGGELVIDDTFGEQCVKLAAGDAILYSGSSLHRVTPVTRGVRFAAFFWVQSLVREDQRRRMLFDLDRAIQALGADHPEHGSVDTLTALYHNLLREWSET